MTTLQAVKTAFREGETAPLSKDTIGERLSDRLTLLSRGKSLHVMIENAGPVSGPGDGLEVRGALMGLPGQAGEGPNDGVPARLVFRSAEGGVELDISLECETAQRGKIAAAFLHSHDFGPDAFLTSFEAGPEFVFGSASPDTGDAYITLSLTSVVSDDILLALVEPLGLKAASGPAMRARLARRRAFRSATIGGDTIFAELAGGSASAGWDIPHATDLVLWLDDLPEQVHLAGQAFDALSVGIALPVEGVGQTQVQLWTELPGTGGRLKFEAALDLDAGSAVFCLNGSQGTLSDVVAAARSLVSTDSDDPLSAPGVESAISPFEAVRLDEAWVALAVPTNDVEAGLAAVRAFGIAVETSRSIEIVKDVCTLDASVRLRVDDPFDAERRLVVAHFEGALVVRLGDGDGLAIGGSLDLPSGSFSAYARYGTESDGSANDALSRLGIPRDGPVFDKGFGIEVSVAGNLETRAFSLRASVDPGAAWTRTLNGVTFCLETVTLAVSHVEGATTWSVEAHLSVASAEFDLAGIFDDDGGLSFRAQMNGTLDVSELTRALFEDAPGLPADDGLRIADVVIEADFGARHYSARGRTDGPWAPFEGIRLEIEELAFEKSGTDDGSVLAATIVADIAFGETVALQVSARKEAEDEGWTFGGQTMEGMRLTIADLAHGIGSLFDHQLATPRALDAFEIRKLTVEIGTATGMARFTGVGYLDLGGDSALKAELTVSRAWAVSGSADDQADRHGFAYTFDLALEIDGVPIRGRVDSDADMSRLLIAYHGGANPPVVDLLRIAGNLLDTKEVHMPSLEIKLEDVFLVRESRGDDTTSVFGVDIGLDASFDFANVPALRALVGDGRIGLREAGFLYASSAVPKQVAASWNAALSDATAAREGRSGTIIHTDADGGIPAGSSFRGAALLGEDAHEVFLPLSRRPGGPKGGAEGIRPSPAQTTEETRNDGEPAPAAKETVEAKPTENTAAATKWFDVGKSLGPLHVARIGLTYSDGKAGLILDSGVDLAGLHVGLKGLAVRSEIKSQPKIDFDLDGLDLAYSGGPIEIAGAFLRVRQDGVTPDRYDGAALLKAPAFAVTGIGSYTSIGSSASIFIFAALHAELGGPPFFRVQGLSAGFGYNRKLTLPPIDKVQNFPLVRAAKEENFIAAPTDGRGVDAAFTTLAECITPSEGDYWLAIGVKFSSFELVRSVALLTVSFGNDVEIGVLGLSSMKLPKGDGAPIAYLELALRVSIKPSSGLVAIEGRLTDASFLLSKDCRITGGFAFYTWFAGPHSGDFIVTLGGYHPRFKKPAHYPVVPRLAVDWKVSSTVSLHAELYFALTPSCIMAGGRMSMVYASGNIRAWFAVEANFLMYWDPLHYEIEASIVLGVSVKLWLFTVHAELGVKLALHGPPFGGRATVKLSVVTFTIRFGEDRHAPALLDQSTFEERFLTGEVLTLRIGAGLIRQCRDDDGISTLVNAHALALEVLSLAPAAEITIAGQSACKGSAGAGIAPMGIERIDAKLCATLTDSAGNTIGFDRFDWEKRETRLPEALWKGKNAASVQNERPEPSARTMPATIGARLKLKAPEPVGTLPPIDPAAVMDEEITVPTFPKAEPVPDFADEKGSILQIDDDAVATRRERLIAALTERFDLPVAPRLPRLVASMNDEGAGYFQAEPRSAALFAPEASK